MFLLTLKSFIRKLQNTYAVRETRDSGHEIFLDYLLTYVN